MSLSWDVGRVKDYKEVVEGTEWSKTHALIWAMLTIGMSGITQKNAGEVFARINACQKLDGAFFRIIVEGQITDAFFTKEDITRRIGLTTNASVLSDRVWWGRFVKKLRSAT